MVIRAVLFDAAGTLIELAEPVGVTYARFGSHHGVTLPASRVQDAYQRVLARAHRIQYDGVGPLDAIDREREWWRKVVRDTFRATDQTVRFLDFDGFFAALFAHYATAAAWRLRPGARGALAELRARGLSLGVVSNFDHRLTDLLESLEIAALFETIARPGQHGVAKPDRRLFEAALVALGAAPGEAVYVGDDPERDLAGAREAGLVALDVRELASLSDLPARIATLAAHTPTT